MKTTLSWVCILCVIFALCFRLYMGQVWQLRCEEKGGQYIIREDICFKGDYLINIH